MILNVRGSTELREQQELRVHQDVLLKCVSVECLLVCILSTEIFGDISFFLVQGGSD